MDLCAVSVAGYRRFRSLTTLKTNGKLVALVGPNEAGKSSFLGAVKHLSHDEPPVERDISRGLKETEFRVLGRFFLSPEDATEARLPAPMWFIVSKSAEGPRSFELEPNPPKRDLELRGKLLSALHAALEIPRLKRDAAELIEDMEDRWAEVRDILQLDIEDLDTDQIEQVRSLAQEVAPLAKPRDAAPVRRLLEAVDTWSDLENQPNPNRYALEVLARRIPTIIEFGESERDLRSEYSISNLSSEVPAALKNLSQIAQLDLDNVLEAHSKGDDAQLTTMEHAANKMLQESFGENWRQSGVHVTFRIQGDYILVQVVNEKSEFTSFAERSDGLRQFVALQSFANSNWSGMPILLIDEAEQKLHYDAQADLVQMLARQNVASKVIYTTHSAGCLPEDLGNGVRLARPSAIDETRSEIINKFWADNEPGFAPLLFGMGASTLAFFPTRNAVMVEGASDMLLLPTMFREVLEADVLGFQIVPGLAESDKRAYAPIMSKKSRLLYLVDGDPAGAQMKKQLLAVGVSSQNIYVLKNKDSNAVDLEDFVDADLIVQSVNRLLGKFHGAIAPLKKSELVAKHRTKELRDWFKRSTRAELPKVELAYEILDIISNEPGRNILDPKRKAAFACIANAMLNRLKGLN